MKLGRHTYLLEDRIDYKELLRKINPEAARRVTPHGK